MDHYKYLKYKHKYCELKHQFGSSDNTQTGGAITDDNTAMEYKREVEGILAERGADRRLEPAVFEDVLTKVMDLQDYADKDTAIAATIHEFANATIGTLIGFPEHKASSEARFGEKVWWQKRMVESNVESKKLSDRESRVLKAIKKSKAGEYLPPSERYNDFLRLAGIDSGADTEQLEEILREFRNKQYEARTELNKIAREKIDKEVMLKHIATVMNALDAIVKERRG